MSSTGPQLPPHLSKRKRDDHETDADATGPQPPPPKTARPDFADNPGGSGSGSRRRHHQHQQGEDEEARETAIRLYTEQTRGKSMYEEHQAALREGKKPAGAKKEEEDDPSKRAFDREKDMAVGGRITHAQRRDLMKQAVDFGGRFQKGKYL
ncbi:hypothetical protein MAPG_00382 [Magnaporthiopsis poae ATCC 64411]|uniref:DUF3752 domain-containing protein n=1 Tax=Magnaporthiopsis poae (strain ATCC 64411 / 73-15) TaxID=644358 RepID=A0A0C4DKV2_MAGP6|nr:hypothetical protein MAPG_00382 [Magnaporthiopsis poae ATCC 64411]